MQRFALSREHQTTAVLIGVSKSSGFLPGWGEGIKPAQGQDLTRTQETPSGNSTILFYY